MTTKGPAVATVDRANAIRDELDSAHNEVTRLRAENDRLRENVQARGKNERVLQEQIDELLTTVDTLRAENERLRAALEDKYENTKAIANMVKDSEAACHRIVRAIRRRAGLEP